TDRLAIVFAEATPHLSTILERAREYRAQGRPVLLELKRKNLGRQLHDLETRGFTRIGIVGDDGTWQWRGPTARATAWAVGGGRTTGAARPARRPGRPGRPAHG